MLLSAVSLIVYCLSTVCAPVAHTDVKWLINTGNLGGCWPPSFRTGDDRNGTQRRTVVVPAPNTIARLQMIRGGTAAVLVMPAGDGGHRCCGDETATWPQFSLGLVHLRHGFNNLYPIVRPYPNWRAFTSDVTGPGQNTSRERSRDQPASTSGDVPSPTTVPAPDQPKDYDSDDRRRRIVNAVDAFLDDRGRLLWVLDTGDAADEACRSNAEDPSPPKFLAVDVHTNQTLSVVSLSRMWQPGVSCFQYIVAIYPDSSNDDDLVYSGGNETVEEEAHSADVCLTWPLVVITDSGTNRLLVYSHTMDRFTEIRLPLQEEEFESDIGNDNTGYCPAAEADLGARRRGRGLRRWWPTPPVRDVLYAVPLSPRAGRTTLLVTYRSCPDVYNVRLRLAAAAEADLDNDSNAPRDPITGALTTLGRKPCRMVVLGTDRRRTDVEDGGQFAGGGTTVYFRLGDANDVWSWDTSSATAAAFIDPRQFRLVRRARTCRYPVAVSAAPATGNISGGGGESAARDVRQLVWVLETNLADHLAGTADRMGANAKLQPIEAPRPSGGGDDDDAAATRRLRPSLRVRPSDYSRRRNVTARPSNRCFTAH